MLPHVCCCVFMRHTSTPHSFYNCLFTSLRSFTQRAQVPSSSEKRKRPHSDDISDEVVFRSFYAFPNCVFPRKYAVSPPRHHCIFVMPTAMIFLAFFSTNSESFLTVKHSTLPNVFTTNALGLNSNSKQIKFPITFKLNSTRTQIKLKLNSNLTRTEIEF